MPANKIRLLAPLAGLALAALVALAAGEPARAQTKKDEKKPGPSATKRDPRAEEKLRKDSKKVSDRHSKDLEPILRWCVEKKLAKQSAELLETIEAISPDWKTLEELRGLVKPLEAATEAPSEEDLKEFQKKINYARDNYGVQLFKIAKDCARYGMYSRAYDLIGEVLLADPDHSQARKIRGYVKVGNAWETKYAANMLKTNVLYKDKEGVVQGWVPKKDVKRWDDGLRPFAGGWLPEADEVKKCQQNPYRAWVVETEHFEMRTSISRATAWEFGQLLEAFYDQFFRTFLGFFDVDKGVELLFDTKPLKSKHAVLYLPSRNHYLQHVKAEHGNDELLIRSGGFYTQGGSKCTHLSHFFRYDGEGSEEEVLETTYHEVTHQLFAETRDTKAGGPGARGNNWVSEGIASYIETWGKDRRGRWVPGKNTSHGRLMTAKRALEANSGWSLAAFVAIGHEEWHKDQSQRGVNYALGAALSHFLMHYDDERYKEDFVTYIRAYYEGRVQEDSLFEHLQIEAPAEKRAETLEKQFKEYMAKLGGAE